ncbi:MAG: hypothetical protein ABI240_14545 [Sphingomonas sp.]
MHRSPVVPIAVAVLCVAIATPASAAQWWYAGRNEARVVFIDAGSIRRARDIVDFSSKEVIRKPGDPVAMTVNYMRADCARRQLGWLGIQQFGYDEAVIDTSTRATPEMAGAADSLSRSELDFICSKAGPQDAAGYFPLTIDDAAFTEALLGQTDKSVSPRALHDRLAADTAVPVIRSTAPATATFGQTQTVKLGEPMVPPRDYEKGPQIPDPKNYESIEVGRIYDVAYQGIKDGQIQFEIRGYSIDDMVHPGSGQTETADLRQRKMKILDLAITIKKVLPDRITYSVALEKRLSPEDVCPPDGCGQPVDMPATSR